MFEGKPTPHLPLNLEIILDHDANTPYRPNDPISGIVFLRAHGQVPVQDVQITFLGTSNTHIVVTTQTGNTTHHKHYNDSASLVHMTEILLHRPQILHEGEVYRLPFRFVFPAGTDTVRRVVYHEQDNQKWSVEPHTLPPTFSCKELYASDNMCSVAYALEVTLSHYYTNLPPTRVISTLLFMPAGPPTTVLSTFKLTDSSRHYATRLLASEPIDSTNASTSLWQRLQDRFSSSTPRIDFTISCTMPRQLVVGETSAFTMLLRVEKRTNDAIGTPKVSFRIRGLLLTAVTTWRATGDPQARDGLGVTPRTLDVNASRGSSRGHRDGPQTKSKTTSKQHAVPENDDGTASKWQPAALCEVDTRGGHLEDRKDSNVDSKRTPADTITWGADEEIYETQFLVTLPADLTPSFTSFAISLRYKMQLYAKTMVGEKEFSFMEKAEIELVAPATKPTG